MARFTYKHYRVSDVHKDDVLSREHVQTHEAPEVFTIHLILLAATIIAPYATTAPIMIPQ